MENQPKKIYFLIILVLGLFLILESLVLVNQMKEKALPVTETPPVATPRGILSIVQTTAGQGAVMVDTPEPLAGVDVILAFDPELVSVSQFKGNPELFEQVLVNTVQQKEGRIKLTAYSPYKVVEGEQTLANFNFRLLKDEPAKIEIEFLGPDRLTDSNLVSQASQKDVLGQVLPLNLAPESK